MPKHLFHHKKFVAKLSSFGSHCLSRLLLSTIVAFVLFSDAEVVGPLSVRTTNPRYFFDASGRVVYLAGSYQNPYNLLNSGPGNFSSYFDFLAQQNHNFTRLWAWEESPWTYDQNGQVTFSIQPYERTGPGLALDGGLKFDLTRFNQAYFDQLRARVIQAGQRGIYVSLILFEGFSSQRKVRQVNPWLADPFQRDNNVNGINADPNGNGSGEEFFSLSYPSITALQEVFVRQVVDTLNDLDNVLYEVSGDTLLSSLSWQYHMIDYVKSYQSTKPNQHPLGISQFYVGNVAAIFNSQADWIVILGTDFHPPLAKANKVLFLEGSPSLFQYNKSDQWVWRTFTRGYNPIYPEPQSPIGGINDSVHAAIGQTRAYSQFVNLASMSPSNNVCSTDFCLASPGAEYLIYLPSGGRISVDLSASSRNLLTAWFDTATGRTISRNTVSGGTQMVFTSPISGQSVLQILADGLVSSQTTGTSNSASSNTTTTPLASSSQNNRCTVTTPTITPNGGIYSGYVTVTLKTNTGGATIYYTTDGQSPTQSAKKYTGAFTLGTSTLVKAKAFKNNFNSSSEASAWFTKADTGSFNFSLSNSGDKSVNAGSSVTNSITATLGSGSAQPVSFSASGLPSGATASFSYASCSPTCSTVLSVNTTGATTTGNCPVTVTAVGGGVTRTTAFTLGVTVPLTVATPTITPNSGSFTTSVSVTVQTATSGASIYYTTDGSSPTQSSTLYAGAMTLTSSAVVKAKAFKSGYTASAEASASFTKQVVGASDLVAYWKFDEGSGATALDSSGNGNTGNLMNGPLWTAGRVGNALYFDGIDDNVTIPDSTSLDLSGSFTLSAWVNPASTLTDFRSILVKNYTYYLYAGVSGYCGDGSPLGGFEGSSSKTVCQPSPLPINAWTYLALSYNGSTLTLYRDGIPVATSNAAGALSATTGTLQIGASQEGEYFKGLIDEVRIYKRALTDTEIQAIYQQESVETSQTVATSHISPIGGTYGGSVSVTTVTATSGASIYYTTDGSTPTQSSTLYTGTMTLTSSRTVRAKAFKNGYNASTEASTSFTISKTLNFSLSNSGDISVVAGSSVTNSTAATLVSGSSQAVSFSVSGLPSGPTGSFSLASCSPTCSSALTIATSGSTPAGKFPITVTSTGGGLSKTTAFTLSVATVSPITTASWKYVSPNGSGTTCSSASPCAISRIAIAAAPGDTWALKNGTYSGSGSVLLLDSNYGVQNGTQQNHIRVMAENPGSAILQGDGSAGHVLRVANLSWWDFDNLVVRNRDNPGYTGSQASIIGTSNVSNITFKKIVATDVNTYGNNDAVLLQGTNILIEDSDILRSHRNFIACYPSPTSQVTIRRVYVGQPVANHCSPVCGPGDGFVFYDCHDSVNENSVAEGLQGYGFTGWGNNNTVRGGIALYNDGGLFNGTASSTGSQGLNFTLSNFIGVSNNGTCIYLRPQSAVVDGVTCLANSVAADNSIMNGISSFNLTIRNAMVKDTSNSGFYLGQSNGSFTTKLLEYNQVWNTAGINGGWTMSNTPTSPPGDVNPAIGSCVVYVPSTAASRGKGKAGADVGGNIIYAYQ